MIYFITEQLIFLKLSLDIFLRKHPYSMGIVSVIFLIFEYILFLITKYIKFLLKISFLNYTDILLYLFWFQFTLVIIFLVLIIIDFYLFNIFTPKRVYRTGQIIFSYLLILLFFICIKNIPTLSSEIFNHFGFQIINLKILFFEHQTGQILQLSDLSSNELRTSVAIFEIFEKSNAVNIFIESCCGEGPYPIKVIIKKFIYFHLESISDNNGLYLTDEVIRSRVNAKFSDAILDYENSKRYFWQSVQDRQNFKAAVRDAMMNHNIRPKRDSYFGPNVYGPKMDPIYKGKGTWLYDVYLKDLRKGAKEIEYKEAQIQGGEVLGLVVVGTVLILKVALNYFGI